ncbi:unnamed protein product [Lepeophtheirus salmonis]|uniref:(salmon louse) hypothetical protein n=1 Tax=Lepeophtheirus salmonis TaxID=72036 RepID=A0A7R8CRX6_LEPSM|nr:unnamed protein product [Lepeophtheirus salmonis]CAF2911397.1 unnamed protein product [Lepeophtheirus salmonis]
MKKYFVENNVPIEKQGSIITDGAPAMTGRHSGFIALCKADSDFPKIVKYHCIIHQLAICPKVMRFDHVMTPVIKIICAKVKQHRSFKILLQDLSAEHSDLFLRTEAFMESREEDTKLLSDAEWLLDLAFRTDMTVKLNQINIQLQGKDRTTSGMVSAVKALKAILSF